MALTIQAIVCAVDFSPFSSLVVEYGVALARRAGVRLYLIHAVHDPQDEVHPTTIFERGGDLAHLSDDARQRLRAMMTHAAVEWEAVIRFGDPVEQTVAFVNSLPPSLLVSASHGVSGFRRLFIGTVVERLTRALNHPMLVVKPKKDDGHRGFKGFRSVVVSCDGRGHWQRLAPLLPLLQPDAAACMHLVHALEKPTVQAPRGCRRGILRAGSASASGSPESWALRPGTVSVSPYRSTFRYGRPRCSRGDDTQDRPGTGLRTDRGGCAPFRHGGALEAGSTTEALLRHAHGCVLTVPEPVEPTNTGGDRR